MDGLCPRNYSTTLLPVLYGSEIDDADDLQVTNDQLVGVSRWLEIKRTPGLNGIPNVYKLLNLSLSGRMMEDPKACIEKVEDLKACIR